MYFLSLVVKGLIMLDELSVQPTGFVPKSSGQVRGEIVSLLGFWSLDSRPKSSKRSSPDDSNCYV